MKIYWLLKHVPELTPLTPKERQRVHTACLDQHFMRAPLNFAITAAFLIFLVAPGIPIVLSQIYLYSRGETMFWTMVPAALVGAVIGRFVFLRIAMAYLRPFYGKFIADGSAPAALKPV